MKKLIAMIGAVAMSFGLFAATSFTTSFDTGDAGVKEGAKYTSEEAGWSGLEDPLTLKAYDTETDPAYAYDGTDRRFVNANLQYLPLETEKNVALNHDIGEGNVFVDQLVRFTGFEDPQTNLVDGVKIAVWMGEFFNDEETAATTNLYVTVGSDNIEGQIAVRLAGTYEIGKWYRLTIKSLGDIFNAGSAAPRAGFCIWIDGVKKAIASDDDHYNNLIASTTQLKDAAKAAYAKSQLFPAVSFGSEQVALNSFGYNGIGAIDDVYVDDVGPDFTVETVDVTVTGIPGATFIVKDAEGNPVDPEDSVYKIAPGNFSIVYSADEGFILDDKTVQHTTNEDMPIDDSDEIKPAAIVVTVMYDGEDPVPYADEMVAFAAIAEYTQDPGTAVDVEFKKSVTNEVAGYAFDAGVAISIYDDYDDSEPEKQLSSFWDIWGGNVTFTKGLDNNKKVFFDPTNEEDEEAPFTLTFGGVMKAGSQLIADGLAAEAESITLDPTDSRVYTNPNMEDIFAAVTGYTLKTEEIVDEEDPCCGLTKYYLEEAPVPGEAVAKIGDVEYNTLQEALDAAAGADTTKTVVLLKDVEENVSFAMAATRPVKFDLDGYTLTGNIAVTAPAGATAVFTVLSPAAKPGTIVGDITVTNGKITISKSTTQDVTVKGGIVLNNVADATIQGTVVNENGTAITLNDGLLKITNTAVIEADTAIAATDGEVRVSSNSSAGAAAEISGDIDVADGVTKAFKGGVYDSDISALVTDPDYKAVEIEGKWVIVKKDYVAEIVGGAKFETLAAAFTAAQKGNTITMLKDVVLSERIFVMNEEVTLDLAGKKIEWDTSVANKSGVLIVCRDAELTIDDSSEPSTGVIDAKGKAYAAVALTHGDDPKNIQTDLTAKLIVNGGKLNGNYQGIVGNGTRPNTYIEINGGVITASNEETNQAIFNPQTNSVVVINGGAITGLDSAIEMRGGTLTVNGGTLTSTAEMYAVKPNGSGSTVVGAAVAVSQHTTKGDLAVEIKGGTLTGLNAVAVANPQKNDSENVGVVLGDATYNGALAFSADGNATVTNDGATIDPPADYKWDENGNLVKKVYVAQVDEQKFETLAAAFTAAQKGNTITMLKDVVLSERIFVMNEEVTLDLAGKKIEWDTSVANKSGVLIVCRDAELTIDDSSEPSTGVIDAKGKAYAAVALTHGDDPKNSQTDLTAKLIVNGGTLIGNYQGIVGNGTRPNTYIEINGGVITASNEETNQAIFNPQTNSVVVINGGAITGLDSAIEMRGGTLTVNGGTLTSTAEMYAVKPNGSGSTVVGAAVAVSQHTTKGDLAVEIKGGTLTGLNAVAVANPQKNDSENVGVVLGDATYNGALAFSADGNATVEKDPEAEILPPEGYRWNENGVLVKLVTATFISEGETVDTQVIDAGTAPTNVVVTKEGYTFTGWDPEIGVITEDTTYTAQFEIQMLTLTVKEVEHTTVEVTYDGTTDTTNGVYTLAYGTEYLVKYTPVAGYQGSSMHQGTLFDNTTVNQPKPTAIKYTITYTFTGVEDGDLEKVVNENPKTYTIESETITFVNASCEGYTFKGWDIAKIDAGSTGDKTITGTFEKAEDPLPIWVPAGEKEAYNTWKQGPGKTESDFTGDVDKKMEDSFLLDCEPTEAALQTAKANFKITSITKDTSGNWVVLTVGQEDNTAYRNGLIKLEAFESVGCTGTPVTPGTQPQLFWKASLVHPTAN